MNRSVFSINAVGKSLRLSAVSFVDNPVTLLLALALILITSFFRCVIWGCDLRVVSAWSFVKEHIAPGLILAFLFTFIWNWWRR